MRLFSKDTKASVNTESEKIGRNPDVIYIGIEKVSTNEYRLVAMDYRGKLKVVSSRFYGLKGLKDGFVMDFVSEAKEKYDTTEVGLFLNDNFIVDIDENDIPDLLREDLESNSTTSAAKPEFKKGDKVYMTTKDGDDIYGEILSYKPDQHDDFLYKVKLDNGRVSDFSQSTITKASQTTESGDPSRGTYPHINSYYTLNEYDDGNTKHKDVRVKVAKIGFGKVSFWIVGYKGGLQTVPLTDWLFMVEEGSKSKTASNISKDSIGSENDLYPKLDSYYILNYGGNSRQRVLVQKVGSGKVSFWIVGGKKGLTTVTLKYWLDNVSSDSETKMYPNLPKVGAKHWVSWRGKTMAKVASVAAGYITLEADDGETKEVTPEEFDNLLCNKVKAEFKVFPREGKVYQVDWDGKAQAKVLEVGKDTVILGRGDLKESSGNQLEVDFIEFNEMLLNPRPVA